MSAQGSAFPLIVEPSDLPPLPNDGLVLLDGTYLYRPQPPDRDAGSEYLERRLAGARFWSLQDVSEPHEAGSGLKLMLPGPERFAAAAGAMGITAQTPVVVYDTEGGFSSPRTVFTFLAYGHKRVSMLNGGLPAAIDAGLSVEHGPPANIKPVVYPTPTLQPGFVASYEEVISSSSTAGAKQIVDARAREHFNAGHIPTAVCLPWRDLLETRSAGAGYYRLPTVDKLKRLLEQSLGADNARRVWDGSLTLINSCGGGLSAAILWLLLLQHGIKSELYDESWSGYSQRPNVIVERT